MVSLKGTHKGCPYEAGVFHFSFFTFRSSISGAGVVKGECFNKKEGEG